MDLVFWISLGLLGYIYAGYPILAWVLARLLGREPFRQAITPSVTLLLPAYNEEAHIEAKVRNSLALDYPKDRLEIVVASDGSTDGTDAIVASFAAQGVRLLRMSGHVGKSAMLSRVVPHVRGTIVVFSDATIEAEPGALRQLVQYFADPRVGCVCGTYRFAKTSSDLRAQGEGLYWTYEAFIKRQESRLHSVVGAHGPFYAIRRAQFQPLDSTLINDDYLIPMRIVAQGYRAVYAPDVITWERELVSMRGEFARRRRIAAGNCQQIIELWSLLSPRHGRVAFCLFSHKVVRTVAPLFMISLLVSSLWLPHPWALVAVAVQATLYLSALAGYLCQRAGKTVRWLSPPLYFCLGNLAMLTGLLRFCFSRQRLAWDRARS